MGSPPPAMVAAWATLVERFERLTVKHPRLKNTNLVHLGTFFIEVARQDMRKWFVNLPDQGLVYFPEGTDHFDDYVEAVAWAQDSPR